jgi:hypothetical protein
MVGSVTTIPVAPGPIHITCVVFLLYLVFCLSVYSSCRVASFEYNDGRVTTNSRPAHKVASEVRRQVDLYTKLTTKRLEPERASQNNETHIEDDSLYTHQIRSLSVKMESQQGPAELETDGIHEASSDDEDDSYNSTESDDLENDRGLQ